MEDQKLGRTLPIIDRKSGVKKRGGGGGAYREREAERETTELIAGTLDLVLLLLEVQEEEGIALPFIDGTLLLEANRLPS